MSSAGFISPIAVPRRIPADRSKALARPGAPVVACAAVVALLPLLQPGGPANSAPVDLLIGIALAAAVFWAVSSGQTWRFPYAFPMLLILTGGAIGAMAGTVPIAGATALAQDVVLLAWCWAVVNVCRSADNLKILVRTWAYSSLAWAGLLFVGLATSTSALTGRTPTFGSRTMLTFGDPNVAANYLVISIMIIWATQCPRRRAPRLAGYALLLAALATTGSNGGIVGIIVAVTVAAVLGVYVRAGTGPRRDDAVLPRARRLPGRNQHPSIPRPGDGSGESVCLPSGWNRARREQCRLTWIDPAREHQALPGRRAVRSRSRLHEASSPGGGGSSGQGSA